MFRVIITLLNYIKILFIFTKSIGFINKKKFKKYLYILYIFIIFIFIILVLYLKYKI